MAADESNPGWFLHSQGRRFGPLSDDEMRGYFRAGMVRMGDMITVPGQAVMQAAADVAQQLNEAPPKPAPVNAVPIAPTIIITSGAPPEIAPANPGAGTPGMPTFPMFDFPPSAPPPRNNWLVPVVGLVVLVAMMFFGLMYLRKFQGTRPVSSQVASEAAVDPGAPVFVPGTSTSGADEGLPPDAYAPAQPAGDATSREWFEKADKLSREWDWPGLATLAQQWSVAEPQRNEPWLFLGSANARLGKNAEAIAALDPVLKRDPTHVVARTLLADVYLQDGQHQNAVTILRDLLRADPNNSVMWNNLGNALIAMNQYDESVTALETAVRIDPKNRQAWANLGTVYQKGGYPDRAAAAFANAGTSP
ncbi:MAG: hypothetical protein A3E01_15755 [Gammaproteobacteria bacterium RIFCSPHIGHO2_12_FULL_63_22]|nr:MAG: hypothetical protein A3E01_15755 [Gammaproteobacteria bacterium RIFCSPHIGHO2_12_FULL_63_22]